MKAHLDPDLRDDRPPRSCREPSVRNLAAFLHRQLAVRSGLPMRPRVHYPLASRSATTPDRAARRM